MPAPSSETSDGGYIVAGETDSFGAGDSNLWVLKIDSGGNIANCPIASALSASGISTAASGTPTAVTSGPGILHFPQSNPLNGLNTHATVDVPCFTVCTYSILPTSRSHGSGDETEPLM